MKHYCHPRRHDALKKLVQWIEVQLETIQEEKWWEGFWSLEALANCPTSASLDTFFRLA